jgi:hypothetical protein
MRAGDSRVTNATVRCSCASTQALARPSAVRGERARVGVGAILAQLGAKLRRIGDLEHLRQLGVVHVHQNAEQLGDARVRRAGAQQRIDAIRRERFDVCANCDGVVGQRPAVRRQQVAARLAQRLVEPAPHMPPRRQQHG